MTYVSVKHGDKLIGQVLATPRQKATITAFLDVITLRDEAGP